jgi:hypothetical protein
MAKCTIDGCVGDIQAAGLCPKHYRKKRLYGDPLVSRQVQHHGVTLSERFWMSVRTGTGCWEWTAGRDPNGYGRIAVDALPMLAHRLSWEIARGVKLTLDQHVMHECDNPSCVRPSHLRLGNQAANMADKMAKGRHVYGTSRGVDHGCAKLTEADVLEIRASADKGTDLAARFGVSTSQISDIRNLRVWKHLD